MNYDVPLVIITFIIMAILFGFLFMKMDRAVREQHRRGEP
jgi:hypothetical protein